MTDLQTRVIAAILETVAGSIDELTIDLTDFLDEEEQREFATGFLAAAGSDEGPSDDEDYSQITDPGVIRYLLDALNEN